MTVQKLVLEIAATRKSSVKDVFREAYNRYFNGEIPEDELVKDCKAFHDHWCISEYVEDYIASIYGLL